MKDVKEGDWIFTIQDGWAKVIGVVENDRYPIVTASECYDLGGKYDVEDSFPSAWTYDPINGTNPPEESFDVGERVFVKDDNREWQVRYLAAYLPKAEYPYYCHDGSALCLVAYRQCKKIL